MVKAILFDFWGTLAETGTWSPLKQIRNILRINVPFPEYVVRVETIMMTKNFNSLPEIFEAVCKEFNVSCSPRTIEELVGMWNKSWLLAKPYAEVESVLTQLKTKYRIILVSNTDCFSLPRVLSKYNFEKYFEKIFLSFEMGLIKTDKNFLMNVLDYLQLSADECVLVGDSLQSDIASAKKVGIKAILIDRKGIFNVDPKVKNLEEIESLIA